ncbi:hypothetical protein SUGI_0392500 [Cryptomeria japonica]|nr:hypothetical protein SUGI_0392500 [Cryptomeria japonica]
MAAIRFTSITVPGPSVCNNSLFPSRYSPTKRVFQEHKHKRGLNVGPKCSRNPPPGNSSSKAVLDAFFIGKAFSEALNERIGAAVGEFLSEVGRLQAEQQKQTRDFQANEEFHLGPLPVD